MSEHLACCLVLMVCLLATTGDASATGRIPKVMTPIAKTDLEFRGFVGDRIKVNQENWLKQAPKSNPGMLQMFRDRERNQPANLNPWSGEFAGKYLTSAVLCYRLTRDKELLSFLREFINEFRATQGDDGYLGPWWAEKRMLGPGIWDLWGQYHCMLGLYLWYEETGDREALDSCLKCADYFTRYFLDGGKRVADAGDYEMNESCAHIFTLLHQETGNKRYLDMATEIMKDFERPGSGDYIRQALAGKEYFEMPQCRWEGLHAIQAIGEMYHITGDEKYRTAFERIWWSIAKLDRHNTGGFSSGEKAQGNPYHQGAIETCCTIAWMAMTVDMLQLTGDSRVADELELSTFNAVLGSQEPNGRWYTYNTPMDGVRRASTDEIAFQARPGTPELNCCSVNGPRGLGFLSEWAIMTGRDGSVTVNYYGPSKFEVTAPNGRRLTLSQETDYPRHGRIRFKVGIDTPSSLAIRFRIPAWSEKTSVHLNGGEVEAVAGTYLTLDREWKDGDTVEISLDMRPWFWVGERECEGKVSVHRGPILLAHDQRFGGPDTLPELGLDAEPEMIPSHGYRPEPWILVRLATKDSPVVLCDFASAGNAGNRYTSWLPTSGRTPAAFSTSNLFRLQRK